VAEPVRVRRLTDQEGQRLQQIVRRGSTSSVRYRRAMMLLASAGGNRVPVIAQLVQADEDTVRDVIHRFNEIGLACLDPNSLLTAPAAGTTRAGLFECGTTTPFWTLADEASTESGVGPDAHGGGRVGCRTDASGGPGLDVSQQSGGVRRPRGLHHRQHCLLDHSLVLVVRAHYTETSRYARAAQAPA
jgi:transposase